MLGWLQTQGQGWGAGYELVQALHIISVVFWIAAMLMLPRLFAYHHKASGGGEAETILAAGEQRLGKLIMTPAMSAAWVFGLAMLWLNPTLLQQGWMHTKLLLVVLLSGYHGFLTANLRKFAKGDRPLSEKTWRMLNEIPALGAILVIVLAVLKPF